MKICSISMSYLWEDVVEIKWNEISNWTGLKTFYIKWYRFKIHYKVLVNFSGRNLKSKYVTCGRYFINSLSQSWEITHFLINHFHLNPTTRHQYEQTTTAVRFQKSLNFFAAFCLGRNQNVIECAARYFEIHKFRYICIVRDPTPVPPLSKNICIERRNRIRSLTLRYILNSHS